MSKYAGRSFGDIGDIISIIPTARALGSMELYVENNPLCKPILAPGRFDAIKILMDESEYIDKFEPYKGQAITHDMATFRDGGIPYGYSLARLHADWVGVKISEEPWLKVEPDPAFEGCIVINRSTRHRNHLMNWRPILQHYEGDLVFLGLKEEHIQLQNEFGVKMKHHPTSDLLECAQIIGASRAFLGNQSCLVNIAIGLGKKFLLETSLTSLDCIYHRPDSYYCLDGSVIDFEVEGYETLNVESCIPQVEVDFLTSPPGQYWLYQTADGIEHKGLNAVNLMREVNRHEENIGLPLSVKQDLANYMHRKFPTWSGGSHNNAILFQIENARNIIKKKQAKIK